MWGFLVGVFLVTCLSRFPIRFAIKSRKRDKKLESIDACLLAACGFSFEAMMIYAYCTGEISFGSLLFISLIILPFPILISIFSFKSKRDENEYWEQLYLQTNQHPERADYGLCRENPIWAGTADFYFSHLQTLDGHAITYKRIEIIEIEKKNGFYVLNDFYACELAKYEVYQKSKCVDIFYICTKGGLDKLDTWHAPRGYRFI